MRKREPETTPPPQRVERLHETCKHLVRFLRQGANYARACELDSFADSLAKSANGLERSLLHAVAGRPADESQAGEDFVDEMIRTLRDPRNAPNRVQILWAFGMLRRARAIVRRYLTAGEFNEPPDEIANGRAWLDEIERGP